MTKSQRIAIARLISDLIKADKIIDENEISFLLKLEEKYSISSQCLVNAQKISFSDAINELVGLRQEVKNDIKSDLFELAGVDGNRSPKEALLLLAIDLCLCSDDGRASVFSCPVGKIDLEDPYVVYVESQYDEDLNSEIKKYYRHITNSLKLANFEFVYIPCIVEKFNERDNKYTFNVLRYMSPELSEKEIKDVIAGVSKTTTASFCRDIISKKMGSDQMDGTEPALLINIGYSYVPYCAKDTDAKEFIDFLKIDIAIDNGIEDEVNLFLEKYSAYMTERESLYVSRSEEGLRYFGFYKALLDFLIYTKDRTESSIVLDHHRRTVRFSDYNNLEIRLSPKEFATYYLILKEYIESINEGLPISASGKIKQRLNDEFNKYYDEDDQGYTNNLSVTISKIKKKIDSVLAPAQLPNLYKPEKKEVLGVYKIRLDKEKITLK